MIRNGIIAGTALCCALAGSSTLSQVAEIIDIDEIGFILGHSFEPPEPLDGFVDMEGSYSESDGDTMTYWKLTDCESGRSLLVETARYPFSLTEPSSSAHTEIAQVRNDARLLGSEDAMEMIADWASNLGLKMESHFEPFYETSCDQRGTGMLGGVLN